MNSRFDHHFVLKFALVQAKLALVAKSSDVLSDLNDLKEVKKLDTDLSELISDNFKSGLVPQDPLEFFDSEITSLVSWGKEVQKLIDHGDDLLSPEQLIEEGQKAGIEKMRQLQLKIEVFQSDILPKAADLRSKIPKQYFTGNTLDPAIIEIWQLRLAAGAKINKIINLSKLIGWLGQTEEKQDKVLDLKKSLGAHSKLIEKLTAKAKSQLNDLDDAILKLEYGNLSEAGNLLDSRSNENRFYDSHDEQWSVLESKINYFYKSLKDIKSAGSASKIIRAIDYIKLDDNWKKVDPFSELGLELRKIKKKVEGDRLKFWTIIGALSLVVISAIIYARKLDADMKEKAHLAQVAAAKEKADADVKAEEDRVAAQLILERLRIADLEKAEAERLRTENELIAAKAWAEAKAEAERIAAAEKAEAERTVYLKSLNASLLRANISQDKVGRLLIKGGTVVAWGSDYQGQSTVPKGLSGVVAIAAGVCHSLALKSDGTVVAWGRSGYKDQSTVPQGLSGVVAIAAGRHSLALKSDGTVVGWGNDQFDTSKIPQGLSGVVAIASGDSHSLALKSDGTVVAWGGSNYQGESTVPQGLSGVVAIDAGFNHSLALKSDGTVIAWGDNRGQNSVPQGLSGVVAIAAGFNYSLALKSDGTVVAWGNYVHKNSIPQGLSGVVAIAAGVGHSLALKSDGTVVARGSDQFHTSKIPQGLSGVVTIAAGDSHNLALKLEPDN